MLQNCGANAYRSPEGDCYCNKNFEIERQLRAPPEEGAGARQLPGDSVLKNGQCVKEAEPEYRRRSSARAVSSTA